MRPTLLVLALALILGPSLAPAAIVSELAYDYGLRVANTTTAPPTFSFEAKPARFVAGNDSRAQVATDVAYKFALGQALPSGATIASATLSFGVISSQASLTNSATVTLDVMGSAGTGGALALGEFGPDYLGNSANIGTATVPVNIGMGLPAALLSYDVTSLVRVLAAAGAASLVVQVDDATGGTNAYFAAPGDANPALRPTLTINFATVPEPGSLALLAVGAVVVGAVRRRAA